MADFTLVAGHGAELIGRNVCGECPETLEGSSGGV